MNKKFTSSILAALMIAGTTSFTAFASMSKGTVVIGNKAFDINYLNDIKNSEEIKAEIVAGGTIYVKDFEGKWINNITGLEVSANVIPAVVYKNADKKINYDAADKDSENILAESINVTSAGNATSVVNGGTLQMSAAITPVNATNKAIMWSVIAGTGTATIDEAGLLKATGVGTVTVKASNIASGVTKTMLITVSATDTSGGGGGSQASTPIVNVATRATSVSAGQHLSDAVLSGTFKNISNAAVAGTLTWDNNSTTVNSTGNFAWTFTPTDTVAYSVVRGIVVVSVVNATVSTDVELQAAVANPAVTSITLSANIEKTIILNRLVDLDLNGKTLTGNVTYNVNSSQIGAISLTNGAGGKVTGDLSVTAPGATVNNSLTVLGNINIYDVSGNTWNENASANKIIFNDPDKTTHLNIAIGQTVASLTLNTSANVTIPSGATISSLIIDTGATGTNINLPAGAIITTATVKAADVIISGKGSITTAAGDGTVNLNQAVPTGLAGVAPTSELNDGKITGTTTGMEYKLSTAGSYTDTTGVEITNLVAGTYEVRYATKVGFNAGLATSITVADYVAPIVAPLITLTGAPTNVTTEAKIAEDSSTGRITGFTGTGKTPIKVTLMKGSVDYSKVRVEVKVTGETEGVQLIAQDTDTNWYNIVKSGWGIGEGFALADANTNVYLVANTAGPYTATINLVDVSNNSNVLATTVTSVTATDEMRDQVAPTNLTGLAPTSASTDGSITGTTVDMQYKLASADDSTYAVCSVGSTPVKAGNYLVRLAAKTGLNASPTTAVKVDDAQGVATVYTETELKSALGNSSIANVELGGNITATSAVIILREVTIDGNDKTLILNGPEATNDPKTAGLGIFANSTVKNLIVSTTNSLKDNLVEVYGPNVNAILENITICNSVQAAMYVEYGAKVILQGKIAFNGNEWGGIEVKNATDGSNNVEFAAGVTLTYTRGTKNTAPVVYVDANATEPSNFVTDNTEGKVLSAPIYVDAGGSATVTTNPLTKQVWWNLK